MPPTKFYNGRGQGYPRPPTPPGEKIKVLTLGEALKLEYQVAARKKKAAASCKKKAAASRKKKTDKD